MQLVTHAHNLEREDDDETDKEGREREETDARGRGSSSMHCIIVATAQRVLHVMAHT